MKFDPIWFAVEQIKRVLESLGWKIISEDLAGDTVQIKIEKPKSEIMV